MIRRELQKLLDILSTEEYRTAAQLANGLEVSEKTARLRIKALNEDLEEYGAEIISKARFGYKLCITNQKKFNVYENQTEELAESFIPDTGEERSEYHMDFRNDFDVRMTLNQHLVPLDIRLRLFFSLFNTLNFLFTKSQKDGII